MSDKEIRGITYFELLEEFPEQEFGIQCRCNYCGTTWRKVIMTRHGGPNSMSYPRCSKCYSEKKNE